MGNSYQILTSRRRDILTVKLTGQCNSDNADAIARDVVRIIGQHQPSGILVDVRELEGRLNSAEAFYHVRNYPPETPRDKIAIVDLEHNREYCEFYALAASNLGYNLHCFYNVDKALQWLLLSGDALAS